MFRRRQASAKGPDATHGPTPTIAKQKNENMRVGLRSTAVGASNSRILRQDRRAGASRGQRLVCADCKTDRHVILDPSSGCATCTNCGLVVGNIIDEGSEWRTFTNESDRDDPSRVGGPSTQTFGQDGLSTQIRDSTGEASFVRFHNKRNSRSISDAHAPKLVALLVDQLVLPTSVSRTALSLIAEAREHREIRARGTPILVAACVYLACRLEEIPRTLREIASVNGLPVKLVGRCFKNIETRLDMHSRPVQLQDIVPRWCSFVGAPPALVPLALAVSRKLESSDINARHTPATMAATAMHLVSMHEKVQSLVKRVPTANDICSVSGVAVATINSLRNSMEGSEIAREIDELLHAFAAAEKGKSGRRAADGGVRV